MWMLMSNDFIKYSPFWESKATEPYPPKAINRSIIYLNKGDAQKQIIGR